MSKFKIGDRVRYVGKLLFDGGSKEVGEIVNIDNSGYPNDVKFEDRINIGAYSDASLELITAPTTLEKLVELQMSGKEFMVGDGDIYLFDAKGSLLRYGWESELTLNEILKHGIKEMPWTPKEGELYFYINYQFRVYSTGFSNSNDDILRMQNNNYFKTDSLAEIVKEGMLKKLKEANHG